VSAWTVLTVIMVICIPFAVAICIFAWVSCSLGKAMKDDGY
jgi:hypothetical protein